MAGFAGCVGGVRVILGRTVISAGSAGLVRLAPHPAVIVVCILRRLLQNHQIVGADVPVNDARRVDPLERLENGRKKPHGLFGRHLPFLLDVFPQRDAVQVFHHQKCRVVLLEIVQNRDDRLFAGKIMQHSGLSQEPLFVACFPLLDGDPLPGQNIGSLIGNPKPSDPDHPVNGVSLIQQRSGGDGVRSWCRSHRSFLRSHYSMGARLFCRIASTRQIDFQLNPA